MTMNEKSDKVIEPYGSGGFRFNMDLMEVDKLYPAPFCGTTIFLVKSDDDKISVYRYKWWAVGVEYIKNWFKGA